MRRRGIVMELSHTFAVVMTSDGEFLKLPRVPAMDIGHEVSFDGGGSQQVGDTGQRAARRRGRGRRTGWYKTGAAVAAACLAIAAGIVMGNTRYTQTAAEAYAFVSIDINPSVALQVAKDLTVKKATGLNPDGVKVIGALQLNGEPMEKAIQQILNTAVNENMMPNQDAILISTAPVVGGTDVDNIKAQAQSSLQSAIEKNPEAVQRHPQVYAIGLSHQVWSAADKAKISPGKFAAYLMASEEGYKLTLSDLSGSTLSKVLSSQTASDFAKTLAGKGNKQLDELLHSFGQGGQFPAVSSNSTANGGQSFGNGAAPSGSTSHPGQAEGHNKEQSKGQNNDTKGTGDGHKATGNHVEGSGSGHPPSGHSDDSGQGSVTVQVGNTVITVPLGSPSLPGNLLGGSIGIVTQNRDASYASGHGGPHQDEHHGGDEDKRKTDKSNYNTHDGDLLNTVSGVLSSFGHH